MGRRVRRLLLGSLMTVTLLAATTGVAVQIARAASLVNLTGVVTDAAGNPAPGTTVRFNGETTTTGSDGTYTLHVPQNTGGAIDFTAASGTDPDLELGASPYGPNGLTVGTTDVQADLQ